MFYLDDKQTLRHLRHHNEITGPEIFIDEVMNSAKYCDDHLSLILDHDKTKIELRHAYSGRLLLDDLAVNTLAVMSSSARIADRDFQQLYVTLTADGTIYLYYENNLIGHLEAPAPIIMINCDRGDNFGLMEHTNPFAFLDSQGVVYDLALDPEENMFFLNPVLNTVDEIGTRAVQYRRRCHSDAISEFVVTVDGLVYVSGDLKYLGEQGISEAFVKVNNLENIVELQVPVDDKYFLVLDRDGQLYISGQRYESYNWPSSGFMLVCGRKCDPYYQNESIDPSTIKIENDVYCAGDPQLLSGMRFSQISMDCVMFLDLEGDLWFHSTSFFDQREYINSFYQRSLLAIMGPKGSLLAGHHEIPTFRFAKTKRARN